MFYYRKSGYNQGCCLAVHAGRSVFTWCLDFPMLGRIYKIDLQKKTLDLVLSYLKSAVK